MSTQEFQLDAQRTLPGLDYITWMHRAAQAGKAPAAMIREIVSLLFGPGKLQPEEYFLYQLYDDERFTPEAKRTFLGSNGPQVPSTWADMVNDKPTLTALLRGHDLPVPETQAIVHPTRTFGGAVSLRTDDEVRRFLRRDARYPIFGKPIDSACSLGTANISGFDGARDRLVLADQRMVEIDELVREINRFGFKYLFQTLMRPHPALVPIVGNRVCTVRMFVLFDEHGCELLRASWKIPANQNGADNFWRAGNMLAGIDVATGRVIRTLRRTPDGTEPIEQHPVTGASFVGLVFPEWEAMRETVLRAAVNLPGCHYQGWDVALTDQGPVLVELEGDGGDMIMEQLCFDTGLLQGRYLEHLRRGKLVEKAKRAMQRARRSSKLKRNLAALAMPSAKGDGNRPVDGGAAPTAPKSDTLKMTPGAVETNLGPEGTDVDVSVSSPERDSVVV